MKEVDVVIDLADRDVVLGRLIAGELEVEFATNIQWEGRMIHRVRQWDQMGLALGGQGG